MSCSSHLLVMAMVVGGLAHTMEHRVPRLSSRAVLFAVAGWAACSAVLLAHGSAQSEGAGIWPSWVPWQAVLWIGATAIVFALVCYRRVRRLGFNERSGEKVRRYGTLWPAVYACAWLVGAGKTGEAWPLIALLAVALAVLLATELVERSQRDVARTTAVVDAERAWQFAEGVEGLARDWIRRQRQAEPGVRLPDGQWSEPFMVPGGSVRGILAAKLSCLYIGIDISPEQVAANKAQLHVCNDCVYKPRWVVGDGEDVVALVRKELAAAGLPPDTPADFVHTCPPYFDLEQYGGGAAERLASIVRSCLM